LKSWEEINRRRRKKGKNRKENYPVTQWTLV
jgi:hypothetical protein